MVLLGDIPAVPTSSCRIKWQPYGAMDYVMCASEKDPESFLSMLLNREIRQWESTWAAPR